jgi:hypothetical protein
MHVDAPQNITVSDNLNLLCDLELILGLLEILSFLDCVHTLTKFPIFGHLIVILLTHNEDLLTKVL